MKILLSFFILLLLFTFTSKAQTACDSVTVHSVEFDPLGSDSVLKVIVSNQSSYWFSYPHFVLKDGSGDTIATETLNFFGLGPYMQGHRLDAKIENVPSLLPDATLSLISLGLDTLICTFEDDYSLCPEVCAPMSVWIQDYGIPTLYHEFSYTIRDANGSIVYDDSLQIDSTHSWKSDSICLAPGSYEIDFTQDTAAGEQLVKCFIQSAWGLRGKEFSNDSTNLTWAFEVLEPCQDTTGPSAVSALENVAYNVQQMSDQIEVRASERIAHVDLYDVQGRRVYRSNPDESAHRFSTSALPGGIYILTVKVGRHEGSRKVVIH